MLDSLEVLASPGGCLRVYMKDSLRLQAVPVERVVVLVKVEVVFQDQYSCDTHTLCNECREIFVPMSAALSLASIAPRVQMRTSSTRRVFLRLPYRNLFTKEIVSTDVVVPPTLPVSSYDPQRVGIPENLLTPAIPLGIATFRVPGVRSLL